MPTIEERARDLVGKWEHGDEKHRQWLRDVAVPDVVAFAQSVRAEALREAAGGVHEMWENGVPSQEFAARLRLVADDSPPSTPPADVTRRVVRHKRRGTTYTVIGEAELQTEGNLFDGSRMVIYRGDDGLLWARQVEEFEDGRFEDVGANPAPEAVHLTQSQQRGMDAALRKTFTIKPDPNADVTRALARLFDPDCEETFNIVRDRVHELWPIALPRWQECSFADRRKIEEMTSHILNTLKDRAALPIAEGE